MANVWLRQFIGGLDARRPTEASSGRVLIQATDGHISRGAQFEKRAAFVPFAELPVGTVGLSANTASLVVFGSGPAPELPEGIVYQRLLHPTGAALSRVLSAELCRGVLYVVAEFEDASRHHFHGGNRIESWLDGRARASFRVLGGGEILNASASGSFRVIRTVQVEAIAPRATFEVVAGVTGGEIATIRVNGIDLIGAAVEWAGSNEATALAIASAINAYASTPKFIAGVQGQYVGVEPEEPGATFNGLALNIGGADITLDNFTPFSNGVDPVVPEITSVSVGGVQVTTAVVPYDEDLSIMAADIAAQINANATVPNYTAVATGPDVRITAADPGTAANGRVITIVSAGQVQGGFRQVFSGGRDAAVANLATLKVGAQDLLAAPVAWAGDSSSTASAIAAAVNAQSGVSGYTATVRGDVVSILAMTAGDDANGRPITWTLANGLSVSPSSGLSLAEGIDGGSSPGTFAKSIGDKVYAPAASVLHFSGIREPTLYDTDTAGAGFIDISTASLGFQEIVAVEVYQQFIAVFMSRQTQMFYVDPDPALNRMTDTLDETGAISNRTVTAFGKADVLYLDKTGVRSLGARETGGIVADSDIGVPVDDLIVEKLESLTTEELYDAVALIEPYSKRYWLALRDTIFVFSFFKESKVSAWSIYKPSFEADGVSVPFAVDEAAVFRDRVYVRSGDKVLVYGGLGPEWETDATEAVAQLPFLDAEAPARMKTWMGFDAAAAGEWTITAHQDFDYPDAGDVIAEIEGSTFNAGMIPANGRSTHTSLEFRSRGSGPASIASVIIHYESGGDED